MHYKYICKNTVILLALCFNKVYYYKFGQQQLVMVNYARGLNQSETGKYFESIIIYD